MSRFPRLIPIIRHLSYAVVSAGSGVAWAGCMVSFMGDGRNRDIPVGMDLLFGAISGVLVGLLMIRFYGAKDWRYTFYSAPLALWIGAASFLGQTSLYLRPEDYFGVLGAVITIAVYVLIPFLSPFFFLVLFSGINGLVLRLILRCGVEDRAE